MFDIYVITSGTEFYHAIKTGGTGFKGFKGIQETQLFRNPKNAKATIRRLVLEFQTAIERAERSEIEERFITSYRERLVMWQKAKVVKLTITGTTDV